jgi:CheY-like chemotaxis protein
VVSSFPFILVVEDNADDTLLLRLAFERAGASAKVLFLQEGGQAVTYLERDGPHGDRTCFPLPDLFLVDVRLPDMTGFELLEWVHVRPALRRMRVGVLSGLKLERDEATARALGASFYILKPNSFATLVQIARRLGEECVAGQSAVPSCGGLQKFGEQTRPAGRFLVLD